MSINTSGSESKARVRLTAMPTKTRSFEAQRQQVTQSTADGGWSPTVGHRQVRASQTDFEVLAPSERGPAEQPSREAGFHPPSEAQRGRETVGRRSVASHHRTATGPLQRPVGIRRRAISRCTRELRQLSAIPAEAPHIGGCSAAESTEGADRRAAPVPTRMALVQSRSQASDYPRASLPQRQGKPLYSDVRAKGEHVAVKSPPAMKTGSVGTTNTCS